MYNLLVSNQESAWNGEPYIYEAERCLTEYTNNEIKKKFGALTEANIAEIRRLPCVFAYETGRRKDPKFGLIRDVIKRSNKVKIEYEIIDIEKFLVYADFPSLLFELNISDWEMSRTHWTIKNVDLAKELRVKGIQLPQWTRGISKIVDITTHTFDVALSFPGEIRNFIEPIAEELEKEMGTNSYFYDKNYTSQLARPSLDDLLQDIYRNRSKLVVVFLCEKYQEKEWCGIEFRAIKEIIMERQHKKIMFVKMDDGEVSGVFKNDGYVDGRIHTPQEIARFIQERVALLPK